MLLKKYFVGLVGAAVFSSLAVASDNGTMTIVVPYSSGSVLDTAMRIVAEEYSKQFKQVVIIENKPGGEARLLRKRWRVRQETGRPS
ncbi:hypothetical protein [Bordetella trematum]|uniref:hypothetical protein n=1 Tax=Bordetella trematum TaxID=123899 RepID=UPI003AF362E9